MNEKVTNESSESKRPVNGVNLVKQKVEDARRLAAEGERAKRWMNEAIRTIEAAERAKREIARVQQVVEAGERAKRDITIGELELLRTEYNELNSSREKEQEALREAEADLEKLEKAKEVENAEVDRCSVELKEAKAFEDTKRLELNAAYRARRAAGQVSKKRGKALAAQQIRLEKIQLQIDEAAKTLEDKHRFLEKSGRELNAIRARHNTLQGK